MPISYPRIPYGMGNFRAIREEGFLYVDKTRFLRPLEDHRHVFLIRPRRFGKTCWVGLLECYYDRTRAERFEAVFAGTDIGASPTPLRSRYVVLRLDFSSFNPKLATLEARFEEYCEWHLQSTLRRNRDLFPDAAAQHILAPPGINAKLDRLFSHVGEAGIPLYVLIDEYDNFANTVLAYHGEAAYQQFTHGEGFYRAFFATLKAGTARDGGLDRLFMTGVSPITLDDVTSGFNIARNISLSHRFNEMLGFTEAEVRGLLEMYRDLGVFDQDVDTALATMRTWYDGYRFSPRATTSVYNTDMVLYYLAESIPNDPMPYELIDDNVRIDYGKLRHLMVTSQRGATRLNGNFDHLRHLVAGGEVESELRTSFPLKQLTEPEHFLSLLHFFGLLSLRDASSFSTRLGVPNQTVKQLIYGYLRDAYRDVGVFSVNQQRLYERVLAMAAQGAWRPVVEFLASAIAEQTGIRDYIAGEKVLQGFLAAYLSLSQLYLFHSEMELNKGHADIVLEPFTARYPALGYGYVIELKYVKRSERPPARGAGLADVSVGVASGDGAVAEAVGTEGRARDAEETQETDLGARSDLPARAMEGRAPPAAAALLNKARGQLRQYLGDVGLRARHPTVRFIGLALVFHGWELVAAEAVETDAGEEAPAPSD